MDKNHKGLWIIRSVRELSSSQKKQLHWTSISIGLLVSLLYFELFFLFDGFPDNASPSFFYYIHWIIILSVACALFGVGAALGLYIKLVDLGFSLVLPEPLVDEGQIPSLAFSDHETKNLSPYLSSETPLSINPASGLPMCGSSGVDTSGNPVGSNSWRS